VSTLSSLLEQPGLEQYVAVFADNGVDLDALRLLTERDLQELGVLLGHRRKLLRAIPGVNGDKDFVPDGQPTSGGVRDAPVPHPRRLGALPIENALLGRHHARALRAAGFHRQTGRARCPNRESISPASTACLPQTARTERR